MSKELPSDEPIPNLPGLGEEQDSISALYAPGFRTVRRRSHYPDRHAITREERWPARFIASSLVARKSGEIITSKTCRTSEHRGSNSGRIRHHSNTIASFRQGPRAYDGRDILIAVAFLGNFCFLLMDYDSCCPFGTLLVWAPPYFSGSYSSIISSPINFRIIDYKDIAVW